MNVEDIWFSKFDIKAMVADAINDGSDEITAEELVDLTIETVLEYVVEWLRARGDQDVSDDLDTISFMEE